MGSVRGVVQAHHAAKAIRNGLKKQERKRSWEACKTIDISTRPQQGRRPGGGGGYALGRTGGTAAAVPPLALGKQDGWARGAGGRGYMPSHYEKRTYSGPILEIERYYATDSGRPLNSINTTPSTEAQDVLNGIQSWRKLVRLVNCNFSRKAGDLCITLPFRSYMTEEKAKKAYSRFLRKVRTLRKKMGLPELKYIIVAEVQSGKPHAHVILNAGISMDELVEMWDAEGAAWISRLDDSNNYKDLAAYLTRQHKPRRGGESTENAKQERERNKRRWSGSHNLEKPIVKKRKCKPVTTKTVPRAPKGYALLPGFESDADRFGNMWIRWTCIRLEEPTERGKVKRSTKK